MTDLTREGLVELAAKVEQASGPDRELDALIAATARTGTEHAWAMKYPAWLAAADGRVHLEKNGPSFEAPAYTASLDAAMKLLDGVGVMMHLSDIGADGLPLARVGNPETAEVFNGIASCIMTDTAPTAGLALALCAAALKARARAMEAGRG